MEDLPLRIQGYPELKDDTEVEKVELEDHIKQLTIKIEKELIREILFSSFVFLSLFIVTRLTHKPRS